MAQDTDRKRKADVLGRWETSSKLGRGSLSGWTVCPLCPTNRQKKYALGRGISAHLHAVHTPWKIKNEKQKPSKRQRAGANQGEEESRIVLVGEGEPETQTWNPTPQEEHAWAQQVLEITGQLEKDNDAKSMLDRTGKPTQSYRESLPPLLQAAADGNIQQLQRMVNEATSQDELSKLLSMRDRNGSIPEHWAAGGGYVECLKFLLESRDKLSKGPTDSTAEEWKHDQPKKLRRRDGKTCLHYAARNGKLECIRYLVEERSHAVDVRSGDGTTPLHMACFGAFPKVVQYFIDKGADIHAVNDWLCSAAHWTAMSQSQSRDDLDALCQLLCTSGVSFVVSQKQGHSALHKAAQKQNRIVAEWMNKSVADGGPGLTETERIDASKPDNGGHRPSEIWSSAAGEAAFATWIKQNFEK